VPLVVASFLGPAAAVLAVVYARGRSRPR
jgi:hypothetical protein